MNGWPTDDDELLAELAAAIGEAEPVPPHVLQAARDTYAWSDIDTALAELTFDSAVSAVGVRGAAATRHLVFEAPDIEIDVMVTVDGQRELVGQLSPPQAVEVVLEEQDGERYRTTSDDLGRFSFVVPHRPRVRLTVVVGGTHVTTDWIAVT